MNNQVTLCITGAAGQIAYSLIPLVLTGQVFKDKFINLRLLDIPQMETALKGVEMEILDGAYPLLLSLQSGSDSKQMMKDANVIIFLGGYSRKPGMERKELLELNGKIFQEQGQALNEIENLDVKCLVVANPANTNCNILATYADKLNRSNFTCLTRLDENRAYAQLSQKLNVPVAQIQDVVVWGNHSTTQYPSVEYVNVNGIPLIDYNDQTEYYQNEFIKKIQKRGGEILEARKNSSVFSAANAVKDHLRDWCYGTGSHLHSMGVNSDGSYGIPQNLYFSFPVLLEGDYKYTIKQGLTTSNFSQEKLKITTQELLDEEQDAGLER